MGCYPLGKMVSRTFRKCSGKGRRGKPKVYYSCGAPATKNVTFGKDSVITIPADPVESATLTMHRPIHPAADVSPSVHAEVAQNKEPDQVRVRSADGPEPHPDPDPRPRANTPGATRPEPGPAYVASSYRYAPSPLPMRWDEGERRRPEYFGGEYRYYPTPVREGIYSIATDANRLTTIFSEENPNACSIA